jgi:deoxycytidine triphosphate deaminase
MGNLGIGKEIFIQKGTIMNYQGIIITGTEFSGRATIAKKLCEKYQILELIKLTSSNQNSAEYNFLDETAMGTKKFVLLLDYMQKQYGVTQDDFDEIVSKKKIPLLKISSIILGEIDNKKENFDFLTFFLDAPDNVLDARSGESSIEESRSMRIEERDINPNLYLYKIINKNIEETTELIWRLWNHRNSGGILSKRLIELMITCGMLLDSAEIDNVSGASYDLSLGDEYYHSGKIKTLSDESPFIPIEPYDYAIVTSKEIANFPRDITARFDLSVSLFCQGIILSNGPQVDPGFEGRLFCLLFNTSNSLITLKRAQHYATIEFHKMIEPTDAYVGKYQGKYKIISYLPSNSMRGAIYELKKELDDVKRENKNLVSIFLGVTSLILAIIALILLIK